MKPLIALLAISALAGCTTAVSQRYALSDGHPQAIKALGITGVKFAKFEEPAGTFRDLCRQQAFLRLADNVTHAQYIQRAFEDELKAAGAMAAGQPPAVVIGGKVNRVEFGTMTGLTGGFWKIGLTLTSSNGTTLDLDEDYRFEAGFAAVYACQNAADAFPRAVQHLVGKAVQSPSFASLAGK